jgi:hypothetical protein
MKKLSLAAIAAVILISAHAQTLYVPSGTSGIGNNTTNSNVGIGTSSPSQKLHVEGNIYLNTGSFVINQTNTTSAKFYFSNLGAYTWDLGTESGNTNFILYNRANSTYPLSFSPSSNMPTFTTDRIRLQSIVNGAGTVNVWDFRCRDIVDNDFGIYNAAQSTYRLYINNLGNVGIGNTNPDAKLTVTGLIHAQEIKVTIDAPGPDYVFESIYKLPSLEEIKTYIIENKHLPEVPSAKEMEKNGVELGEMNMLMLKKIEELTLYSIEMNKTIGELKKENERQNKLIEELTKKK